LLASISPRSAASTSPRFTLSEIDPDVTLTLTGLNFEPTSIVQWNGSALATAFVSSRTLTAVIPAADLASTGTAIVGVLNPSPGGGASGVAVFTVDAPSPPSGLDAVRVFPNPWRVDRHAGLKVTIDGLPAQSEIRFFTLSGRWVKTVSVPGGGIGGWDLTNDAGESVASGFYLYLIEAPGSERKHGTLAVIR
jgi:hypothetical protein